MLAASSEPSAEPAPISEWISSTKTMMSFELLELLEDSLQALLELAAVLGPGDDQRQVERQHPLLGEEDRHPALDDALRQALDDRGLADARLAEQDRVVLGAAREDLDDALDLALAADQRVEAPLRGERREVAAVLREERQLLLLLRSLALLGDRQDLFAQGVDVEARAGSGCACADAAFDAQDADQQVLRTDRGMKHRLGFVRGVGEDLLRFLGERQLGGRGDALDEDALAFDLAPDRPRAWHGSGGRAR